VLWVQVFTGPWNRRNLLAWIGVVAAVFVTKGCLFDQYIIPSGSMEPTLHGAERGGDRVIANKWLYGPRIPFTTVRLWDWAAPKRWDIVVFRSVEPDAPHPVLVKRVVGLPGEKVQIRNGKVFINGEEAPLPDDIKDTVKYTTEWVLEKEVLLRQFLTLAKKNEPLDILNPRHEPVQQLYRDMRRFHPAVKDRDVAALTLGEMAEMCRGLSRESLNTVRHLTLLSMPRMVYGIMDTPELSVVPGDHYLLLGDNSGASRDGRVYGWVPRDHLLGRVCAVWWPWDRRRDFTGFTGTWWGMGLLYGGPAALVLWEILPRLRRRGKRDVQP